MDKKQIKFNFHTHTIYCDGKSSIESSIKQAIALKFQALGFSSHAPVSFENPWSITTMDDYMKYIEEVGFYKKKYKGEIDVYKALEADYIPGFTYPFDFLREKGGLDYIIGGIHLVKNEETENLWFIDGELELFGKGLKKTFNGDNRKGVQQYFYQMNVMIENEKPDVIAHMDKIVMNNNERFFSSTDKWYRDLALETLGLIAEKQVLLEVNTRGFYKKKCKQLFPDLWILKEAKEKNIPIVISSDAHHISELDKGFDEALRVLKESGYKEHSVYNKNLWEAQDL
jgi:histidinol-phosphatase (PHP family)